MYDIMTAAMLIYLLQLLLVMLMLGMGSFKTEAHFRKCCIPGVLYYRIFMVFIIRGILGTLLEFSAGKIKWLQKRYEALE